MEHSTYGQQFKVESYETKIPEDTIAIERYLGSGAIKGVGAALAARIVRRFGEDTMRILDEEPERLAEVKGISERKHYKFRPDYAGVLRRIGAGSLHHGLRTEGRRIVPAFEMNLSGNRVKAIPVRYFFRNRKNMDSEESLPISFFLLNHSTCMLFY